MKDKFLFVYIILILGSCTQEPNIKYTYYRDGSVKEKIIGTSADSYNAYLYSEKGDLQKVAEYKNNLLNGICKVYDNNFIVEEISFKDGKKNGNMIIFGQNGNKKIKRTFLNDTLYGITQLYNKEEEVKQENFYINGKLVMYNEFFDGSDYGLTKKVNYIVDVNGKAEKIGQIVYDKKNNHCLEEMSFFYTIKNKKDTIFINEQNEISIEFVNKLDWKMEVQIGKMNECMTFVEQPLVYNTNGKKFSFKVRPENEGVYSIFGKLIIKSLGNVELKNTYEFILYDDFIVLAK